ncbi:MAG: AMP-binding protein [Myxococcales bacterium]|nr:AMP-binding protein [Myxococcales bacterium]
MAERRPHSEPSQLFSPVSGRDDDVVAWSGASASATYGALRAAAHGVADALRAAALEEGEEGAGDVLLLCEDRYWFTVALLGAWQAGRRATLPPHRGSAALTELRRGQLVLHDGGTREGRALDVTRVAAGATRPLDAIAAEREILVLYTSGSTGEPRPWVKRARQMLGEAQVLAAQLGVRSDERVLATVAPQHIYGLLFGVLLPLAAGASFERSTPLHAETIHAYAERGRASWLVSVPAHLEVLERLARGAQEPTAAAPETSRGTWPTRSVISSGAPLRDEIARGLRALGLGVIDVLGSTETGGVALRRAGVEETWTPLRGVRVRTDADGRLLVRSSFLDEPDVEHVAGDRGRVEEDGRFRHLGRADDVVKIGGKRVSLGEVEAEALGLPGVREARALRHEVGGLRGEEIWLVVAAPGRDPGALRRALRERLDPVLVPRRIRAVPALPRDERGKVRSEALRALFAIEEPSREGDVAVAPGAEREPFLGPLLGEVELLGLATAGERATAELRIPEVWSRFEGHFPAEPVLPAIAQLSDLVLPCVRGVWPDLERLTRVGRLKFLVPLRPGARLTVALERSLTRVRFELRGTAGSVARGTLWFDEGSRSPEESADVR